MRALRLATASLFVAASGCTCLGGVGVPFEQSFTVALETEIGGSSNCAFSGEEDLDADGNAVSTGSWGECHYNYSHNGRVDPPPVRSPESPMNCTVHVVSWTGELADFEEVITQIRAAVDEQGFNGNEASVRITDVAMTNVAIAVERADGSELPIDRVGFYRARLHISDGDLTVENALVVENPGTGPVLPEHVAPSDDTDGFATLLNRAVNSGALLVGTGDADIRFRFDDLDELTDDGAEGEAAPRARLTADLAITGELVVGL